MSLAKACINHKNLQHNVRIIRQLAPNSFLAAVIKANAYGHGYKEVITGLKDTVDGYCVSSINEAIQVRAYGCHAPLIVLQGFINRLELEQIDAYHLQTVLHTSQQLHELKKYTFKSPSHLWLKINTGMNRLGISTNDYQIYKNYLQKRPDIRLGVMTHFSNANDPQSDFSKQQLNVFDNLTKNNQRTLPQSLANSAAILDDPIYHRDHIRPGIMLYGISPFCDQRGGQLGLRPVMSFESKIIALQHCQKGQFVGYGMRYQCPRDMLIGIASVGYGDGYPQRPATNTPVMVGESQATVLGEVSMDMLAIDLSKFSDCRIGTKVVLWGEALPIEIIASHLDVSSYALVAGITERVTRINAELTE